MRPAAILLLPLLMLTVSCGGGASSEPNQANSNNDAGNTIVLPSDTDIITKIYDPDYSVPAGFFVDERASTSQSYTVHHIMDDSSSYELCTDDFDTAEAWEAADNAARAVNGYYVGAYENERYFEFIRELSYDDDVGNIGELTSPGFARVFKCSNTERDGVDRSQFKGYSGKINARPLTAGTLREFAEYFWQFTFMPERYKKVLDSSGGGLERTLLLGVASNQGDGRCDRIEVIAWRFVVDRDSGDVTASFDMLRTFEAELESGSPRLCS